VAAGQLRWSVFAAAANISRNIYYTSFTASIDSMSNPGVQRLVLFCITALKWSNLPSTAADPLTSQHNGITFQFFNRHITTIEVVAATNAVQFSRLSVLYFQTLALRGVHGSDGVKDIG